MIDAKACRELYDPDRPPPAMWLGRFMWCKNCGVKAGNGNAHHPDCPTLKDLPEPPVCGGEYKEPQ